MQAATRELLCLLGRERDTQVAMPMTYLCYLIPDEEGNTSVGNRRLNWVWYWSNFLAELGELLIDKHGQRQTYAVSPGLSNSPWGSGKWRKTCCRPSFSN